VLIALCEQVADDLGLQRMQLDTIAGHDGVALNGIMPSIVVAVPSVNGVIHRNDEFTSEEDLIAGGNVLLQMIERIDAAGGDLAKAGGTK
jgi:N-carbamoyl-L-amino-acid hydrolase